MDVAEIKQAVLALTQKEVGDKAARTAALFGKLPLEVAMAMLFDKAGYLPDLTDSMPVEELPAVEEYTAGPTPLAGQTVDDSQAGPVEVAEEIAPPPETEGDSAEGDDSVPGPPFDDFPPGPPVDVPPGVADLDVDADVMDALLDAGLVTFEDVKNHPDLTEIKGIGPKTRDKLVALVS
jgi:hypothetical protein